MALHGRLQRFKIPKNGRAARQGASLTMLFSCYVEQITYENDGLHPQARLKDRAGRAANQRGPAVSTETASGGCGRCRQVPADSGDAQHWRGLLAQQVIYNSAD